MKIIFASNPGSVGKTTIAAHGASPRLRDAPIISVETNNESVSELGLETKKLRGSEYKEIYKRAMLLEDVILDVGASNVEGFLQGMLKFDDSQHEFDYFFLPVTNGIREQKETMAMVSTLSDLGIEPNRIRIIFNRVINDVQSEFGPLWNYAKKEANCIAEEDSAVFENELFSMLAIRKISLAQVLADETDYRRLVREATAAQDSKQAAYFADMHLLKSLSKGVDQNFDLVFGRLFN